MGNWQYTYVERRFATIPQSGTVTFNLPEKDYIGNIQVIAYSTPTATTNPALPISEAITKIEVIDGGTVIQSLTGNQAQALAMFRGPHVFASPQINQNAVEGHDIFVLNFGRHLRDTEHMLDMSKLSNPQLKITWDYSITTGTHGASYDADTSPAMTFTVLADVYRGEVTTPVKGYIKSSQIKEITQSPSTVWKVRIPRGEKLYGIMLEAGYDALDWTEDAERIKLDFDNGTWVPFEFHEDEIPLIQRAWHGGDFEVSFKADLIDGVEYDVHMGYVTSIFGTGMSGAGRAFEWLTTHRGIETVGFTDVATPTAIAAYEQVFLNVQGQLPFQCWYCPVSRLTDGVAYTIDTTQYGRIDLEFQSGSAASTASRPRVVAEYLIEQ